MVIYSVDMLPDAADSSQLEDCAKDDKHDGICQWRPHCLEDAVVSHDSRMTRQAVMGSSGSQCRPVGAWGRVSHGMRVAILRASDILTAEGTIALTAN